MPERRGMLQGQQGPAGQDGIDGADGRPGRDGRPGLDGKTGAPGRAGRDGRDGIDGKDGTDAMLPALVPFRGVWERDDVSRLTTRVMAGPIGGAPLVELIPYRDDRDDIVYVDILPIAA